MPYPNNTASVIVIAQTTGSLVGGQYPFVERQISGSNLFIVTDANGVLTGSTTIPNATFTNINVTGAITASNISASNSVVTNNLTASNISASNSIVTNNFTASNISASGTLTVTRITASGILDLGNLNVVGGLTASNISASGNLFVNGTITSDQLVGTASWANNALTASSLVPTNDYQVTNLTASHGILISGSFAPLVIANPNGNSVPDIASNGNNTSALIVRNDNYYWQTGLGAFGIFQASAYQFGFRDVTTTSSSIKAALSGLTGTLTLTTGSLTLLGGTASVTANTFVANASGIGFFGTASWAANAQTASYVIGATVSGSVVSSSYALTSSFATTASYANTSSFAVTSSNAQTSSVAQRLVATNSYQITNLTASGAISASGNVSTSGTLTAGAAFFNGIVNALNDITTSKLDASGTINAAGSISSMGSITASGVVSSSSVLTTNITSSNISASNNISGSNGWFNNLTVLGSLVATISGSITNANSASIANNQSSANTYYLTFADGTGQKPLYIDQSTLTWIPSTNTLSSSGTLVADNVSASSNVYIASGMLTSDANTAYVFPNSSTLNIGAGGGVSVFGGDVQLGSNGIVRTANGNIALKVFSQVGLTGLEILGNSLSGSDDKGYISFNTATNGVTIAPTTVATIGGVGALAVQGGAYVGKNLIVSGSTTLYGDLTIFGSSSVVNISSSTIIIGDNRIQLNSFGPGGTSQRYAGLDLVDSGSTNNVTSSVLWDGLNNYWLLTNNQTGSGNLVTSSAIILQGPTSSFGNENLLTVNNFLKVQSTIGNMITSSLSEVGNVLQYAGTISASLFSGSISSSTIYIGSTITAATGSFTNLTVVTGSAPGTGSQVPVSPIAGGLPGQIEVDNNFIYVYTNNTWKRVSLSIWSA